MKLRVKEICREKGLTVANIASRMGILPPALSRIINGSNTTTDSLQKIADALGVHISELFDKPKEEQKEIEQTNSFICPKCGTKFKMEK